MPNGTLVAWQMNKWLLLSKGSLALRLEYKKENMLVTLFLSLITNGNCGWSSVWQKTTYLRYYTSGLLDVLALPIIFEDAKQVQVSKNKDKKGHGTFQIGKNESSIAAFSCRIMPKNELERLLETWVVNATTKNITIIIFPDCTQWYL